MGIRIDPTPPSGDLAKALAKTVEAVWKGFTLNPSAPSTAFDAVKALREKEAKPEQRAWILWRESLAATLDDFFKTANLTRRPLDQEEFGRILSGILENSKQLAESSEETKLRERHLWVPTDFPLYQSLREQLPELVDKIAPEHGQSPEALRTRLDRSFTKSLRDVWTHNWPYYDVLEKVMGGKIGEAMSRSEEWRRYCEHLCWLVEKDPLFGQPEGGAALDDIFVPVRCYWRQRPEEEHRRREDEERKTVAHIGWLRDEIVAWLDSDSKHDLLRVVTGGPGSGKSSSARMLAREVALGGRYNVLFVPLQGLDVSAPVKPLVASYVDSAKTGPHSLSASPLDWLKDDVKPLLLIFDGLDEVARPDAGGIDVTRKFISNLRDWLRLANGGARIRVLSLVLGRPGAAETAADEIALPDSALLHVAPLCPLTDQVFARSGDRGLEILDPKGLCGAEWRDRLWRKWNARAKVPRAEPPPALMEEDLRELTVEPLLLYLLLFSELIEEDWRDAAENRNRVYQAIFSKVHKRDVESRPTDVRSSKDFFTLMECLGLAAWRGGGRTGTTEQFEVLRDTVYAPEKRPSLRRSGQRQPRQRGLALLHAQKRARPAGLRVHPQELRRIPHGPRLGRGRRQVVAAAPRSIRERLA